MPAERRTPVVQPVGGGAAVQRFRCPDRAGFQAHALPRGPSLRRGPGDRRQTVLYVIEPTVLFGTYVRIAEDSARRTCVVHTYRPTMARPLLVAEKLVFDCLPLTDVGYVDLMAWRPPVLAAAEHDDPRSPGTWAPPRSFRFDGDHELPPLWMYEERDADLAVIVSRTFCRGGAEIRRWEVTEGGEPGQEALPRRIRVCRPRTGHRPSSRATARRRPCHPSSSTPVRRNCGPGSSMPSTTRTPLPGRGRPDRSATPSAPRGHCVASQPRFVSDDVQGAIENDASSVRRPGGDALVPRTRDRGLRGTRTTSRPPTGCHKRSASASSPTSPRRSNAPRTSRSASTWPIASRIT